MFTQGIHPIATKQTKGSLHSAAQLMVVELAKGVVQPGASFSDPTSTSRITQSSNSAPSVMS